MTSFSLWMPSPLFLFLTVLFLVFFFYCAIKRPLYGIFCHYCDKKHSLLPAWMLNRFTMGNTVGNQCCVVMIESAVNQHPPLRLVCCWFVSLKKKGVKKGASTSVCTASDYCFFCSVLLVSSQIRALLRLHGMLFVHQANHLLKLYVFLRMLSLWHTASRGGALPII